MNIPTDHFRFLRLAILRQLPVEQAGPDVFKVRSESNPKHWHTVNPVEQSCCCPAFGYCYHLALALDRWMEREAEMSARLDYFEARRLDFGGLHRRGGLHADDRRFLKDRARRAREKYGHLFGSWPVARDHAPTF